MLCLSRKADYALIALAHIAERPVQVLSAREIAGAYDLPVPLLMNILKTLHKRGLLRSTRGVKGGYQLAADLESVSLYELIRTLDGKVEPGCDHDVPRRKNLTGPGQALEYKLLQFLRDVKVSDLVMPGRRIDVPSETLRASKPASWRRERTIQQEHVPATATVAAAGVN